MLLTVVMISLSWFVMIVNKKTMIDVMVFFKK